MTKTQKPDGTVQLELSESDIESAIRHFICACHPELAVGKVLEPIYSAVMVATWVAK